MARILTACPDGLLWVYCWCERRCVLVTVADLRRGLTGACDDECERTRRRDVKDTSTGQYHDACEINKDSLRGKNKDARRAQVIGRKPGQLAASLGHSGGSDRPNIQGRSGTVTVMDTAQVMS